jgi:hypothetical protein
MPRILLSFLAVLLFVCGIAVLFLWVFNDTFPKTLLNRSTAKRAILAFAIDYLVLLLVEPKLYSLTEPLYRSDTTPWLYLIFVSLIMTVQSFFIISMILWLVLKPLRSEFMFRTKTFLLAALGCLLLNVLFNYVNMQITATILANSKAAAAESGTMNSYLNSLVYTDKYRDLIKIANEVEQRLAGCKKHIRVAVMGCAVNGPGEAREADIGIAGGDGVALIFRKGEIVKKVPQDRIVEELMAEIEKL